MVVALNVEQSEEFEEKHLFCQPNRAEGGYLSAPELLFTAAGEAGLRLQNSEAAQTAAAAQQVAAFSFTPTCSSTC